MTKISTREDAQLPGVTRRGFLTGAGALTFAISAGGAVHVARANDARAPADLSPNAWLSIAQDGEIRIVFPATEMGQGSSTALPLILAEELDADWSRVVVDQLDQNDRSFGNPLFGGLLYTAGSTAVYGYYEPLRMAGAQARQTLLSIAAAHWGVAKEGLETEPSMVVDPATGRRLGYGEIVALEAAADVAIPDPSSAFLKDPSAFRLIGSDVPRRDIPAKTRGAYDFGIDVRVPGMAYAVVARAPVEGETPVAIDDADTRAEAGVLGTVELPDGVAVVAETLEAAFAGRDVLSVTWSETAPARSYDSDATLDEYASTLDDAALDTATWSEAGDVEGALAAADRTVERDYRSDYAYHAQFEPMGAVASVSLDGTAAEAWIASQTQTLSHRTVIDALGIAPENVTLHMMPMGGSFGRRTELMQPYLRDALLASKAVGRPVKVLWTREDDVKYGAFRPAAAQRLVAGLTADGQLAGWKHRVATPSVIAYFNPVRWAQVAPNDIISMRGSESKFYGLPDKRVEHVITERRARLAPWRGIGAAYTSFAAEAFMDELAAEAGVDPVQFRMRLLEDNPRGRDLIDRVLEMSDWSRPRDQTALGLSFAGYGDSMAAGVAEISLDRESGLIRVERFWAAIDAGLVVSPDNALAQVEGGVVFGVSSALKERITIREGMVEQENYYDYEILRIDETPEIMAELAQVDAPPTGIGEVGTPMVPAAIANAFHALTGRRLRHMPFTPDRVLEALS